MRRFDSLNLFRASFRGLDLRGAVFDSCNLAGTDFSQANLEGAVFDSCNLSEATLSESALTTATFDSCNMYRVHYVKDTPRVVIRTLDLPEPKNWRDRPSQGSPRPAITPEGTTS